MFHRVLDLSIAGYCKIKEHEAFESSGFVMFECIRCSCVESFQNLTIECPFPGLPCARTTTFEHVIFGAISTI